MISVNQNAAAIVQRMIRDREALGLNVARLKNGATVLDAGVKAPGSLEAGLLFASACMGGLGEVRLTEQYFESRASEADPGFLVSAIAVSVDQPWLACMASQYAGWAVKLERYFAIGSGPARALYAGEEIYKRLEYRDESETAILTLEGRELPGEAVAFFVAEKCGIQPEQLTLLIAPTASLVGSVQVASRSVETGLHKLAELGFDTRRVISAFGVSPLAPVAADDLHAMGRTNDAILYGAQVSYSVEADDNVLESLIDKIPSESARDYGIPFYELFMRYKGDFYQIDPLLFSPALIEIQNLTSGRFFRSGHLNASLIRASLLEG